MNFLFFKRMSDFFFFLGRFAPIFYFNRIYCKRKQRKSSRIFKNLRKIEFCRKQIFEILIIYKPSLGTCEVPHKIWARSVKSFFLFLEKTDRQTNRQAKYRLLILNRYIEEFLQGQMITFKGEGVYI